MTIKIGIFYPPFLKGGKGGLNNRLIIPLNPPLEKGDLKYLAIKGGSFYIILFVERDTRPFACGSG
jgi:hypothetical protein